MAYAIIQITIAFYLLFLAVLMRTSNTRSFVFFRFIPFALVFAMALQSVYEKGML